jgi:hypothetical protein
VRGKLGEPPYAELLMKPLLEKCQQIRDDDREMFPLLECISSIANALGPAFLTYAEPVFQRCIGLINNTLQQVVLEQSNLAGNPHLNGGTFNETDKDFLVVALDLISELIEGVRGDMIPIVKRSNLIQLTYICSQVIKYSRIEKNNAIFRTAAKKFGRVHLHCWAIWSKPATNMCPTILEVLCPS